MQVGSAITTGESRQRGTRLRYVPGLDGLRALAVIAVLLYHADLPMWGGFLGVEAFFALSGYLITALLLAEWHAEQRIDLATFWLRRARRLLPALLFLLAGTIILAWLVLPSKLADLRVDILAALGYIMNWRLIRSGQSYFDPLLRPPLLQHLWSLAVEEQFYLLWPPLVVAGLRWLRPRGLLVLTLLAAAGSTLLMAVLYRPGADPSRIYYGTDTRAAGVLLGAALALVRTPGHPPAATSRRAGRLLDGAGLMALAALLACFGWLPEQHRLLYRGGFALVAGLTVLVIAAVSHPRAVVLPRLLGLPLLRWIGLRSYGLYLWHWPVFVVTRPTVDLPLAGLPVLGLRLAIVVALVELSYRYIELPVRHGAVERTWRQISVAGTAWRPATLPRRISSRVVIRGLSVLIPSVLLSIGAGAVIPDLPRRSGPVTAAPSTRSQGAADTASTPVPSVAPPMALAVPGTEPTAMPQAVPVRAQPGAPPVPVATPRPDTLTAEAAQPLDPALAGALQRLLDDTVADGHIPGAVLAVSIPGSQPWSGASGLAHVRQEIPMQPQTLVPIGSVSKLFTAVVVLQLVEEGKLDLDAPIGTWLPEIVVFADRTTVRQVLNHTSGIYDYLEDRRFFTQAYQNPDRAWMPAQLVALAEQVGPSFQPGAAGEWDYSSTNYVILGMLVEQVTGQPLADVMRQRIFEPVGLTHTFFAPDAAMEGQLAQGYVDDSDRVNLSMTFVYATGNIITTAEDLQRFGEALFMGDLLSPESRATMTTVVETGGAYAMPELQYGLGVMRARPNVGPTVDGAPRPEEASTVLGHIGGLAGFRSAVWWVPESGITIALGLNQANVDPNVLARDVLEVILTWQGR